MIPRAIELKLDDWASKKTRKPLVIRGARQVGKTTVVRNFSKKFKHFLYLNLELPADKEPFERFTHMDSLLQALFFIKNIPYSQSDKTLIFIDEIQEVPEALNILRYFFEDAPEIHVIAAGSLLETIFNHKANFPVGRVEFLVVRPLSFPEFLEACNESAALNQLQNIPGNDFARRNLFELFHTYALIGGMPEIVQSYADNRDFVALQPVYEGLITTYIDDIEKYAISSTQVQVIRHAIRSGFSESGKRIKFQGFGKSNYGSREMGEALRILEKTMLFSLVYPCSTTQLPLAPEFRKSPRLQSLDTGLMNYALGVQKEILGTSDLNTVYQGTMIEHLVGQEILAFQYNALSRLNFWVREKNTSDAEVDFLYVFDGKIIPIEVKSGKEGRLRSLHLFMDEAPHDMAVRFYAGDLNVVSITTDNNKKYRLLNLPYFLVSQLDRYLEWFSKQD